MSSRKLIGRVSATEKNPTTCDDFQFWLSDDTILSPFDIVRVENRSDDSVTYGVVQDILHITDGTGHLSNYVSCDFGNVDTTPMTRRLSLSYAKVSVIHNTKENFMPVFEGSPVYTADNNDIEIALGLDNIDEKTAIPAGLMKASNNVSVPIKYNGDFLIGPEGAHMNISGISGLATKTSYIMFLLKAMSDATSALRRLEKLNADQKELEEKINSGAITSDEKREQIADKLSQIAKKRDKEEKIVRRAQDRGIFDTNRKETVNKILSQTEAATSKVTSLNKKIINADYATKNDLPTSYGRDARKLYQRIIAVIDTFFSEDPKIAEELREAIKSELSVKKK